MNKDGFQYFIVKCVCVLSDSITLPFTPNQRSFSVCTRSSLSATHHQSSFCTAYQQPGFLSDDDCECCAHRFTMFKCLTFSTSPSCVILGEFLFKRCSIAFIPCKRHGCSKQDAHFSFFCSDKAMMFGIGAHAPHKQHTMMVVLTAATRRIRVRVKIVESF